MPKKGIKLGDEIIDVTSNTIGVAIARAEYLSGVVNWLVQPATTDDNEMLAPVWIPDAYCKWHGEGVYPKPKKIMGFHARDEG